MNKREDGREKECRGRGEGRKDGREKEETEEGNKIDLECSLNDVTPCPDNKY